jgi:hypothetical protein
MATIVMESAKVIEACEDIISRILTAQELRRAEKFNEYLAETKFSFRKLCRVPAYTTVADCARGVDTYMEMYGQFYCGRKLSKAKKLLKLAKLGDPVTLTEEDVADIF